jgi:hypothetical protein
MAASLLEAAMSKLKSAAKFGLATVLSLALLLGLAMLSAGHLSALQAFSTWLKVIKPALIALHLTLIALLWLHWPAVVTWLADKGWVHASNVETVLAQRPRIVAMLCAIEIILVIGLPFNLLH